MSQLYNIIPYYENELIYSWMQRLAIANGYDNITQFLSLVLGYSKQTKYTITDIDKGIDIFIKNLPDYFHNTDTYLNTSTYPFYALFVTEDRQDMFINRTFRGDAQKNLFLRKFYKFKKLSFCKECEKESLEINNETYYQRSHQLDNVHVCYKHGCLLSYKDKSGNTIEHELTAKQEVELKYAKFTHDLLNANLDLNINDIKNIIFNKLMELGYRAKNQRTDIKSYYKRLKQNGLNQLITLKGLDKLLNLKLYSRENIFENEISIVLMDLFENVENIPHIQKDYSNCIKQIEDIGFACLSEPNYHFIKVRHNDCGKIQYTTFHSLLNAWGCCYCDKHLSDIDFYKRFLNHHGYEYADDESNLYNVPKIKYLKTRETISIDIKRFLFNHTRAPTERRITYEEAKTNIEMHKDYKLVHYKNSYTPVKIKHDFCGKTFKCDYHNFLRNPWCKECYPLRIKTADEFEKEVKRITYDDYKLISKYRSGKSKITLLHEKCGKTFKTSSFRFLNGCRCPTCTDNLCFKDYKKLVEDISLMKYSCIDKEPPANEMVNIRNNQTGEVLTLFKPLVLQELTRPIPSRILYLENRNLNYTLPKGKIQRFEEYLHSIYKQNDIIHLEDIEYTGCDYNHLKRYINFLVNKNKLVQQSLGIYTFSNYSPDFKDVIKSKFANRNGKIIGYYDYNSFLYNIGYLPNESNIIFIETLKAPSICGIRTTIADFQIRVKRPRCEELNEHNILFLPILDLMSNRKFDNNLIIYLTDYLKANKISISDIEPYLKYYSDLARKRFNVFKKHMGGCDENESAI